MNDKQYFLNRLNKINLTGCEDVKVGDILYYVYSYRAKNRFIALLVGIFLIIKNLLLETIEFEKKGDPDTLFLFSNSYRVRKDLKKSFDRVVTLTNNYIYIRPFYGIKIKLSNLHYLQYLIIWNKQLRKDLPSVFDRLYYSAFLLDAVYSYDTFIKYISNEKIDIKRVVCLCDVQMIDSLFVQKFNSLGKDTITLQHGTMCSTTNTWTFQGSYSKLFIANSIFTVSEAKILDYHGTMIIGGLFSFINNQPEIKPLCKKIATIGVLVDGDSMQQDNLRMIKSLTRYCNKYGKKLLVRLHPSCNLMFYKNEFRKNNNIEFYKTEISLNHFFDLIDIAVIRNSTTLIEAVQYGVPTYIINDSQQVMDVYKNVNMLKFSDEEEFHKIADEKSLDEIKQDLIQAREYFGCFENVTDRYKQIFCDLGIKLG